jgi:hypothetical protein
MTERARRSNSPAGTWNLLSFQYEFEDSDQRDEPLGANPVGAFGSYRETLNYVNDCTRKSHGCSRWRVARQHDRIFRSVQAARRRLLCHNG